MQQDHVAVDHAENHPRDVVAGERAAHLPQAGSKRRAMRSAERPPEFDFLKVLAYRVAVGFGQIENPFANRLAPRRIHIEPRGQFFRAVDHKGLLRQNWHKFASFSILFLQQTFAPEKQSSFKAPPARNWLC